MPRLDEKETWAREICAQVFRDSGVALSEDDSIILIAAVFRRALDAALTDSYRLAEQQQKKVLEASSVVRADARKAIAEEFASQAQKLRKELLDDAESASYKAETAVTRALEVKSRHIQWKHRMEGVFLGAGVMTLGALLFHWLAR